MPSNPYQAPSARTRSVPDQDRRRDALTLVAALPTFLVALGALYVVPQFEQMFIGFDAELPAVTRLMLATYSWWGLIPVSILLAGLSSRQVRAHRHALLALGFSIAILLFFFTLWACYKPILALAAVA